jgi:hypothetical protein
VSIVDHAQWERIESHIDASGVCWEWTASCNLGGYGQTWWNKRVRVAHRVVYEVLVGPVPEGMELDHLCRNRRCVNPDHMEPVTRAENCRRGAGPATQSARYAAITHCPQGHPYNETNTHRYIQRGKYPTRRCRACAREATARYRAKRRGA